MAVIGRFSHGYSDGKNRREVPKAAEARTHLAKPGCTISAMNDYPIQIREATLGDLHKVQSCARAAYSKYIERMEKEPAPMNADFGNLIAQEQVHVALHRGQFVGYVVFYPEGDHFHLSSFMGISRLLWFLALTIVTTPRLKSTYPQQRLRISPRRAPV